MRAPPPDPEASADEPTRALLARWQGADDVDALDELLRGEIDVLARRLRARVGGPISASMSASDLAQEAVLRLLRLEEAPNFDDPRALRAYLWTSAWRLLVNRMQRPGRDVVRLADAESRTLSGVFGASGGIGALETDEQRTALELVGNLLKPEDREALSLVYFQGLSIEEAARRVGISRGALDMRLMRARTRCADRRRRHRPAPAARPDPDRSRSEHEPVMQFAGRTIPRGWTTGVRSVWRRYRPQSAEYSRTTSSLNVLTESQVRPARGFRVARNDRISDGAIASS